MFDASTNCIVYIRVSTIEQKNSGLGLEVQLQKCTAYAQFAGLEVIEVIKDDGVSAGIPLSKRPGGKRALDLLVTGKSSNIIALKLDRLFRNTTDALTTCETFNKSGIAMHLVDQQGTSINTKSAIGKFLLTMLAATAELERNLITERTQEALQVKKSRGDHIGATPFGYKRKGHKLVPNEQYSILLWILEQYEAGHTLQSIADKLNRQNLKTIRGKKWSAGTVWNVIELHKLKLAV
ncbi:recombinase family protein [Fischerella sp. PCC 9605]|uniref:recombinase family protein n=1 Tax=Fischerella sp. PCC 9605 TaxID=1173024 RepID=UPI0005564A02|nr:recombinase family protein [Fischerella sp. PCC 9605]